MSKTTLDLSTLSDITDGAHTVKVKAKANGYRDSEFSNEVSYTKAPAVITYSGYMYDNAHYKIRAYGTDLEGNIIESIPTDDNYFVNVSGYPAYALTSYRTNLTFYVYECVNCTYTYDERTRYWYVKPTANDFRFGIAT